VASEFQPKVAPVYLHCSVPEIISSVSNLVQFIISKSPREASFPVFDGFVRILHAMPWLFEV
jgi:hypothetical protein